MSTFRYGEKVRSLRDDKIVGNVVGFGSLVWPPTPGGPGDMGPQDVVLVQTAQASSSLGPACVVLRADMVEKL